MNAAEAADMGINQYSAHYNRPHGHNCLRGVYEADEFRI